MVRKSKKTPYQYWQSDRLYRNGLYVRKTTIEAEFPLPEIKEPVRHEFHVGELLAYVGEDLSYKVALRNMVKKGVVSADNYDYEKEIATFCQKPEDGSMYYFIKAFIGKKQQPDYVGLIHCHFNSDSIRNFRNNYETVFTGPKGKQHFQDGTAKVLSELWPKLAACGVEYMIRVGGKSKSFNHRLLRECINFLNTLKESALFPFTRKVIDSVIDDGVKNEILIRCLRCQMPAIYRRNKKRCNLVKDGSPCDTRSASARHTKKRKEQLKKKKLSPKNF